MAVNRPFGGSGGLFIVITESDVFYHPKKTDAAFLIVLPGPGLLADSGAGAEA